MYTKSPGVELLLIPLANMLVVLILELFLLSVILLVYSVGLLGVSDVFSRVSFKEGMVCSAAADEIV